MNAFSHADDISSDSLEETSSFPSPIDGLAVNTLRFLAVDAIQLAGSGHPGLPLGAAPMAFTLWSRYLRFNPSHPEWADRDRFVLSAGHGSALLYALLHLFRYDLPLDELRRFRQWKSITPGHPERGATPGVETTTGPLGQGFANAVGMAAAEAHLAAVYNRPGHDIVNHRTYVLCSDGDLMEGVASEAASLAGHLALGKLIALYDDNRITLSASTQLSFTEDVGQRFRAYGWHTVLIEDGNDLGSISRALAESVAETGRPSLLLVRTHIGFGSPSKQDSFEAHGSPLGVEETARTKEQLGWPAEPAFLIPESVRNLGEKASLRGREANAAWDRQFARYAGEYPELAASFTDRLSGKLPDGWDAGLPVFQANPKGIATRVASGKVLDAVALRIPSLFGGSADLNPSTNTEIKGGGNFEPSSRFTGDMQGAASGAWDYSGRNLHFGIREHAMGAILNGLSAHGGFRPFGATFMVFSDYLRPSVRLAAIMHLPIIYIFTHDSIALGEDGATHQPVEQLVGLRVIPHLQVLRPADANETAAAWRVALETKDRPTALVLSRQALPVFDRVRFAAADGLRHGAYVMADLPATMGTGGHPDAESGTKGMRQTAVPSILLVASGSEVSLIVEAGLQLSGQGISVRLVSMPSWEIFDGQPSEYRNSVFPKDMPVRLAVEAGSPAGWHKYTGDHGSVLGVTEYGSSAPGNDVMSGYGFTVSAILSKGKELLGKTANGMPLLRDDGTLKGCHGNDIDITLQKERVSQIVYLNDHDRLTGLYNRRFYEEELNRLDTERNLPISIIMGDINGLKLINDSFGYAMGDELLIKAAEVIRKGCRNDDIVARHGGDEFVILLTTTTARETESILKRITDLSSREKVRNLGLSISFGHKTKNSRHEDIQDIVKCAEDQMYRNKHPGYSTIRSKAIDLTLSALFEKSSWEQQHSVRVSELCAKIATGMHHDNNLIAQIRLAGLLHDIGKSEIDVDILNKPNALDSDEWEKMRRHPEIGYRILRTSEEFSEIADFALEHHERCDGKGYPRGLEGEGISLQARIIAVADSYDAMTTNRTYSRTLSEQEAVEEMRRCSGTQFDPSVVRVLMSILQDKATSSV